MLKILDISGSALTAGRLRLDVIANNIANVEATRTAEGGPYQRRSVLLGEASEGFHSVLNRHLQRLPAALGHRVNGHSSGGVRATRIARDQSPFELRYDPEHPDAGEDGYVRYPNVDLVREMTDLLMANRAYQANASALSVTKNLMQTTLRMGR